MKTKYLIGAAAISMALLTGSMAFAQTPAPTNDNSGVPTAAVPGVPTLYTQGQDAQGQTNGTAPGTGLGRGGMMGQYGGNFAGRGMMNYGATNANRVTTRAPHGNVLALCLGIFVMTVTVLLVWALMILGILTLWLHLKMCKSKSKMENNETKK